MLYSQNLIMDNNLPNPEDLPLRGTVVDWSKISGHALATIRRHLSNGSLPYAMIGQYCVIERTDFLVWLAAGYPPRPGRPPKNPQKSPP